MHDAAGHASPDRLSQPAAVPVEQTDLTVKVDTYSTGWQTALSRPPKLNLLTLPVETRWVQGGRSLKLNAPPLKVHSYVFPQSTTWQPPGNVKPPSKQPRSEVAANARCEQESLTRKPSRTTIAAPSDVVKLEDRLYYMLQPPLESIFSTERITFPFEPFAYQFRGMAFLYPRHAAILADEMGLGKTMQAISAIRLLLYAGEINSILLVCPKPLVSNWQREFELWAPEIPIGVIEGDQTRRHWQWRQQGVPVRLANYEVMLRDADLFDEDDLGFDLVVLDEAQRIKNRSSATSQVMRSIRRRRSWALTGTPVENRLEDLFGILEFLGRKPSSTSITASRLAGQVSDFVLRRTKDMVLEDLPPKLFRDAELDLSPAQYDAYRIAEDEGIVRLNEMGEEVTIQHVFELVLRLKQICNFDPLTGESSKLDRLTADLQEVAASGQKAIVFSQWVQTIDQISERLQSYHPLQYHGKVPSKQRDGILQQFRDDPRHSVLLMSYGAGSVGLNLQFCRYVFLFDRWWNPAVEDQAINRAHRIGAAGSVTVTRMLTVGTIEERINQVLEEKRQLFDTLFSQTGMPKSIGLSQDEVFGLFQLRTPQGPIRKTA